jgi:uncharacterized Zn finger protein
MKSAGSVRTRGEIDRVTTQDRPRFDLEVLRDLAGPKVFARGQDYYCDGQVEILVVDAKRVLAQVSGTEDYRTELRGRGKKINGECSCPAFEDWGFCKHMVAVALAANALGKDAEAEGAGTLGRIRNHLKAKGLDALVEMIVAMAERDASLFHKLDLASAAASTDDKALEERLRKRIDSAVKRNDYIDYHEASDWAADVDEALGAVADLISSGRAALALKVVVRAIGEIGRAVGSIDDSDGHCGALLHRAQQIHLAAVREVRPDPVQLARDLFAQELEDDYDVFDRTVMLYADVLGEGGLSEYRRLATEAWDKLPSRTGKSQARDELNDGEYHRLMQILDFFAERNGNVDARIALRTKDLSSPWSYVSLAEFCLAQGRADEALRRAEEGLWVFEDNHQDTRLLLLGAKLLCKAGRRGDAEVHLWRAFERAPSLELYKQVRKLAGKAGHERAVRFLEGKLANKERIRWYSLSDVLIEILIREQAFGAAWATVRRYNASIDLKVSLAQASETDHPREALEIYRDRVEQLVNLGSNDTYRDAANLIVRMAALQSAVEQASYVAGLKERFGRRRNFMKLVG